MNSTDPHLSVPRQALADLLRAAGSPLTPEGYLASLPEFGAFQKYPGRTRAAVWSRNILLIVTLLAVASLPFGIDVESVVIVIALAIFTAVEFRVHLAFRNNDPGAPLLGFQNQLCFAAFILAYGLYHAVVPVAISASYQQMMDDSGVGSIADLEKVCYLIVGIVGGLSQFAFACYYRLARVKPAPVSP